MAPEKKKQRTSNDMIQAFPTLLHIPLNDFPPSQRSQRRDINGNTNNDDSEKLLLMQLPAKGLTIQDLISTSNNDDCMTRIVGKDGEGENGHDTSSSACLVVETKGKSFSLNRVETSNSLIVIAQQTQLQTQRHPQLQTQLQTQRQPLTQGSKDGTEIPIQYARLIANPSASFIELKARGLNRQNLWNILSKHIYSPFNSNHTCGKSLYDLTMELQCSNKQVLKALENNHAYQLPHNFVTNQNQNQQKISSSSKSRNPSQIFFCILDEEVEINATKAILSAIVEADDEKWLSSKTFTTTSKLESYKKDEGKCLILEQNSIVTQATKLMLEEVHHHETKNKIVDYLCSDVIRHCLRTLSSPSQEKLPCNTPTNSKRKENTTKENELICLNITKIALFVAHQLFNSRSTPWPTSEFVNEWHNRMPGVGEFFEPSIEILAGVALHLDSEAFNAAMENDLNKRHIKENGEEIVSYLKYFPEQKLSLDPKLRFRKLFREKEQWQLHELEPYMEKLVQEDEENYTKAELLLKFTCVVVDDKGINWYRER